MNPWILVIGENELLLRFRVARFFLGAICQNGKNAPNDIIIYEITIPCIK
jgi:hypothetical protein